MFLQLCKAHPLVLSLCKSVQTHALQVVCVKHKPVLANKLLGLSSGESVCEGRGGEEEGGLETGEESAFTHVEELVCVSAGLSS